MTSGIDQIDFKVVFDKLLEINERSVEQLIRFKDMLNKNNDQFDDIIDKIDKISQSLNKFETTIQIIQSKKPLDTLENIDDRTHEEFKNLSNLFADIKNVVNDIHHLQSQFKQNTKGNTKYSTYPLCTALCTCYINIYVHNCTLIYCAKRRGYRSRPPSFS